jgi:hypothetical protein
MFVYHEHEGSGRPLTAMEARLGVIADAGIGHSPW